MRSEEIDRDEEVGWRQDGRENILNLLQEGVFSEPPHVLSRALEFIFDLLDPRKIRIQREPENLLRSFSSLLSLYKSKTGVRNLLDALSKLLTDFQCCNEEYILERLYHVSSQVIDEERIHEALLLYESEVPELITKVRLEWPSRWGINIKNITNSPAFWDKVPLNIWAESWWRTSLKSQDISDIHAPSSLHQHLAISFGTNPSSLRDFFSRRELLVLPQSNWAIWRLTAYRRLLQRHIAETRMFRPEEVSTIDTEKFPFLTSKNIDYSGLAEDTIPVVKDMVSVFESTIITLRDSRIFDFDLYSGTFAGYPTGQSWRF
jgi:hypothetical protein